MDNSISLTQCEQPRDTGTFAERLIEIGNNAGTALMISIGHRTGLFDKLAGMHPATSPEIAAAADLEERYVREWLASMVVAGIVLLDPVRSCYRLPDEHAAVLTRAAAPDNIAVLMQYIAVLGSVENDIVDCFKDGGGVPYSRFERFHEVMAEDSGQAVDSMLLEKIIPLVPDLPRRLEEGIHVLDVGCGSGRALHRLAETFPRSRFAGYDLSSEAIGRASAAGRVRGLSNLRFEVRDATWGAERRFVAATAALTAAVVWTHALAALLRYGETTDTSLASLPLTLAAIAVAAIGTACWPRHRAPLVAAGSGLAAAVLLESLYTGSGIAALSLVVVGPVVTFVGRRFGERLPETMDGFRHRRRGVAILWSLMALVSVVQIARLATFMTDPTFDWFLTTRHPFYAMHECLPAYLYGAELSEQGVDNLYDATHYPGLNRDAHPKTTMTGMLPEDPFQYPPQFLLLPRMVRSMTHDYATVRVVWFALQTTLFVTIVAWLSLWVGGREGRRATTLMPLVLTAFPTLHALQYGQFHLTAVALGVGSLIAFEERRPRLGGAMLAVATLSKIFPGILLVLLFVQRRWHDLAWTTSFIALISFVAWAVLGQAPFAAFVEYQVPRLASGEAFAFGETWPEVRHLLIAGNQGFVGLMAKLVELGMASFDGETTLWASRGYGLVVLILAALLGLSEEGAGRHCRAVSWLAILGLASLASAGAWGDYVPLTGIWLLTLVSATSRSATLTHGACWIFFFLLVGTTPVGTWAPATPLIALSLVGAMLAIGLYGGALLSSVGALASTIKLAPFWKREQRVQSR